MADDERDRLNSNHLGTPGRVSAAVELGPEDHLVQKDVLDTVNHSITPDDTQAVLPDTVRAVRTMSISSSSVSYVIYQRLDVARFVRRLERVQVGQIERQHDRAQCQFQAMSPAVCCVPCRWWCMGECTHERWEASGQTGRAKVKGYCRSSAVVAGKDRFCSDQQIPASEVLAKLHVWGGVA
ncbi:hypothetical protein Bbelb_329060 [Branchiostoma belcheri]|nr:hypothetical protein Bbelb_329060 [Branchiostoma belcheri]